MKIINTKIMVIGVLTLFVVLAGFVAGAPTEGEPARSWSPKAAAAYLDERAAWWMSWPGAMRDRGTFCISCHTALPYALARPALRSVLKEEAPSPGERKLLDNILTRLHLWNEIKPYYNDQSDGAGATAGSRGTESVLNALVLAGNDAWSGKTTDDTRAAFANMWALQRTSGNAAGAWSWIQFDNEPWEAHDSAYYGAALAALAVGTAPGHYRDIPAIQPSLKLLRDYLNRECPGQSPINHAVLLWASARWPALLDPDRRRSIVGELTGSQEVDGGWNLASLVWTRRDFTIKSLAKLWLHSDARSSGVRSDGYATALIALALEQAGVPATDAHLKQALAWLLRNQDKAAGTWPSLSVNGHRDPFTPTGRFMNDAATAYAVLALTSGSPRPSPID